MKEAKRLHWPDMLRILAIFAVIVQHYCPFVFGKRTSIDSFSLDIANVFNCLSNWSVPVFIMISGMFFLDPEKTFSTKAFYLKNVLKIIIIIIVWGIFYELMKQLLGIEEHNTFSSYIIPLFFKRLPWYHLWFLYLILALYMLVPVLRIYIANASKRNIEYIIMLFVLVSCFKLFGKLFTPLHFNIAELTGYVGYFIAGYYLSKYNFSKKLSVFIYIFGLLSVLFRIFESRKMLSGSGSVGVDIFDYLSPFIIITSFAVFLFFRRNISFKSIRINKTLTFISSCVLGIYLFHGLCIEILSREGINPLTFNSHFSLIGSSLLTFVLSFTVVVLIKKIPFINKYIV